jgi:hypothetical protein
MINPKHLFFISLGILAVVLVKRVADHWPASPSAATSSDVHANAVDDRPFVVRTDFSDEKAWKRVEKEISEVPPDLRQWMEVMIAMNQANGTGGGNKEDALKFVHIVDNQKYAKQTMGELLKEMPRAWDNACLFVVDDRTISEPDHSVLVIELPAGKRTFRAVPSEVGAIASNLSVSNMDWEDFAENVDKDGVLRQPNKTTKSIGADEE